MLQTGRECAGRAGWQRWAVVLGLSVLAHGCVEQDYLPLPNVLEVSATQGVRSANIEPRITHDLMTRHALDYQVENTSAANVEVVVYGESLVNGVTRATGRAVHRLQGGEAQQGRLSDLELEMGNQLDIALQCCSTSRCGTREVLCPLEPADPGDVEARLAIWSSAAQVCLDGCFDTSRCMRGCGAEESCVTDCEGDAACEAACPQASACIDACWSEAGGCLSSCLALYARCTADSQPVAEAEVPCSLCAGLSGRCTIVDLTRRFTMQQATGTVVECMPSCAAYPPPCVRDCEALNGDDRQATLACARRCIGAYQEWCTRDPGAVDTSVDVPCCFSSACEARLDGVVKLAGVECFQDSVCGSGRKCNARGLCENRLRDEQSGCVVALRRRGTPLGLWSVVWLGALFWLGRRRMKTRRAVPAKAGALMLTAFLLASMGVEPSANAEPRGFRRTRSSFAASMVTGDFFVGGVGEASSLGLGLCVQESIQSGYFGGSMRIGGALFPAANRTLPFDNAFQTYWVAGGPRFVIPTADSLDLLMVFQPEYTYLGMRSNVLVRETEGASAMHGAGLWVGLQYLAGTGLLELDIGVTWLWPADTMMVLVALGGGFSGVL